MRKSVFLLSVAVAMMLPAISIGGWINNRLFLASMHQEYIPMAPLTALCFLLIGSALLIKLYKPQLQVVVYCAGFLVFIALADVLLSFSSFTLLDLEKRMVLNPDMFGEVPVGRMSPITLFLFLLSTTSLLLLQNASEKSARISGWLITAASTITMVLLVGYLYNSPLLYGQTIIPVALSTSISFFFICLALFYFLNTDYFPLNLFYGTETHVRLLRVFLPLMGIIILASGAVEMYLRENYPVNEALVLAITTLISVTIIAFVTMYKAQTISKEIEQAEAEKNRLISIIDAGSDYVGVFNGQGKPEYLNRQLKRIYEKNNTPEFATLFTKQDSETLLETAIPAAKQEGEWAGEAILKTALGHEIPVSLIIVYKKGSNGKTDWFSMIGRDISKLINARNEMEQFAYTVSHDLKEPLRMVSAFMELLEKNYATSLDEKAKKYIFYARDGSQRMTKMINELLDYSRIGRVEVERTIINLNSIVEEVKSLYAVRIEEKKAAVIYSGLPTISGERVSIKMLMQNLISNALKYQTGEIKPEITILAEELPDFWMISVSDNGIGIKQEYYDQIFNLFSRLHTKEEYSGTGMGLALCKKIAEQHGGKIWVDSTPGQGSTFLFTIAKD